MLPTKTALIVGAGASAEAGLPIGSELKIAISKKLAYRRGEGIGLDSRYGDHLIYNTLQRTYQQEINEYIGACLNISNGVVLSSSIDNFIDTHKHDQRITICGKIAIARTILEAEKGCKLFINPSNIYNKLNFSGVSDTWYTKFYEWLAQGVDKSSLEQIFENLTVISFNYDRCIQHFLTHAISTNFLINVDEAKNIVRKLRIYFPYGSVGPYLPNAGTSIGFGADSLPSIDKILSGLKTYTEQIEDSNTLTEFRNAIAESETLIFLGNQYHDTNINLICGGIHKENKSKKVFATRKGIESNSDLEIVKIKLEKLNFRPGLNSFFFSETCNDLFREYGRSMRGT